MFVEGGMRNQRVRRPETGGQLMAPTTFGSDEEFLRWADRHGVKVANCSGCSRAVSSDPFVNDKSRRLAGRLQGRPHCGRCLRNA